MSFPATRENYLFTIQIGDGASPEVFAHPCLINTGRSLTISADFATTVVPVCNSASPGKIVRKVISTDTSLSGDGVLDAASEKTYADWALSGLPKNIKVNVGATTGDLVLTGSFVLTSFQIDGPGQGQMLNCSLALAQADVPVSSAHS